MRERVSLCLLPAVVTGLIFAAAAFSKGQDITGSSKAEELRGTPTSDFIEGRGGDDTIHGLASGDRIYGDALVNRGRMGDDVIYGGSGNDTLEGGYGADRVFGGKGEDKLEESRSKVDSVGDLLNGGPGDDICFRQKPDRTTGCEAVAHSDLRSEPSVLVCERGCALLEKRYGSDFVER